MQKSGVIPTLIAIFFVTLYSNFSSICLTETGRLIYKIKNSNRKTDYLSLISLLIKDTIFAFSSKVCVLFNHFLYTILSIITLYKIFSEFILNKFEYFQKSKMTLEKREIDETNFFYRIGNEIFNREELFILFLLFISFSIVFTLNLVKLVRRSLQILTVVTSIIIVVFLYFNLINQKKKIIFLNSSTLFGHDYTYVKYF
jgi:hypothetical protein